MPGEPAETLIGVTLIGAGVLFAYGAYRDVPVVGPGGLLTGALQQGKLQPVNAKKAQQNAQQAQQNPSEPWWQRIGSFIGKHWRFPGSPLPMP